MGTVACLWHHGGLKVAVETPQRDCTGAPSTFVAESVPRATQRDPQKPIGGTGVDPRGAQVKHYFGTPGRGFTPAKHTFSKDTVLQALKSSVT